ncbi:hypothetical protein [Streptomyces sp. NPDC012888]|uniref:hypothetical protein n=1 Tax=Streptomyces sp. NPDC012888 TaxID=3364855 RepID=UPI0036B9CDF4
MTTLRADIDQLTRFTQSLDTALTALRDARRELARVRADQLGTAELDAACDRFQERWSYGAKELTKRVTTVRGGVREAAREYAALDAAIREAFLRAAGSTGTGAGHG